MPKEKFLLVSLQEDKAKKLAQVITNDSCRKILDYLADKEATESELAKQLNLPISTVHYNLKQLVDGGLIVAEEFHYSQKGKEVLHYKLANKYIIIAPKSTYGIKERLKSLLPVALLVAAAGFVLQFISRTATKSVPEVSMMQKALVAEEAAAQISDQTMTATAANIPEIAQPFYQSITFWFIVGAVFAIITYVIIEKVREK